MNACAEKGTRRKTQSIGHDLGNIRKHVLELWRSILRYLLFALTIIALLAAIFILSAAENALHEIEAFILFLLSAVLLAGAAIVQAIEKLPEQGRSTEGSPEELTGG